MSGRVSTRLGRISQARMARRKHDKWFSQQTELMRTEHDVSSGPSYERLNTANKVGGRRIDSTAGHPDKTAVARGDCLKAQGWKGKDRPSKVQSTQANRKNVSSRLKTR